MGAASQFWPEEAENVGIVPCVIANGERRFRVSLAAGLTTLNVVHNEDVAKSRAENNDREDLDPIERVIGIENDGRTARGSGPGLLSTTERRRAG
ncbi:hypothetical protein [Streptomyces sp. NPDC092307]|uniref:hypothetical protein n=1 Tax=Streptomyces sp. NPDC092307 TaxID=3366013 RepID=UPI00380A27C7